ncbi:MAG: hypothetical protein ACI8TP_001169 [Acidimicrobiales bacterium]|jgi:hypothetical protein
MSEGNNQKQSQKRSKRRRKNKGGGAKTGQFWGEVEKLPEPKDTVRITKDPAAVIRSLGRPPLNGHEQIAEHYFEAVYQRSVTLASALAAAGDLIDPDEL